MQSRGSEGAMQSRGSEGGIPLAYAVANLLT